MVSATAQEAWLLEMPNRFADFLVQKAVTEDFDAIAGIVEKLPGLVEQKQISEIELIEWKAEAGKHHKKEEITVGQRTIQLGSAYRSNGGDGTQRRFLSVTTPVGQRDFTIETFGTLSRAWMPTFVHRTEEMSVVLLEKWKDSPTATVSLKHSRKLEYEVGSKKEHVVWYSADGMMMQNLSYGAVTVIQEEPFANFVTRIFTSVKTEDFSLLRVEANARIPGDEGRLVMYHTEASFRGVSQLTGNLKKETMKLSDLSVQQNGTQGNWTLVLTGAE